MSFRGTTITLVLAAGLTAACTSSTGSGATGSSGPATSSTSTATNAALCAQIRNVAAKLPGLTALMQNPANAKTIVTKDLATLEHVRPSVPPKVRPAVDDLTAMLTKSKTAIAEPTRQHIAAVQAAGARLPQDSKQLRAYLASNCS